MSTITHALFESASGYALFTVTLSAWDIGAKTEAAQNQISDLAKFSKVVDLLSFTPFKTAAQALENANDVSEGTLSEFLHDFLEQSLPKSSKKSKILLAVSDSTLGGNIKDALKIPCDISERSQDVIRGIRYHASKLLPGLQTDDLKKAQLGLGHSYSRAKLKFNVNRIDNMIIQAIALLDQLDKDVNLFSMRIREWYGYHFPELVRLVPDNYQYASVAKFIGSKETLDESKLDDLAQIIDNDKTVAQNILDAARGSMGADLSEIDMLNISAFAARVVSIAEYRKSLISYLTEKMNLCAPSLTALLGERIGARLISHAGSLTNLSKYPASTVQILGAEKALFRALKTKGNTPKYGLLYHSTFIGRAGPKHKGRISRFLANKCSIASRIDCYSDNPTPKFGEALRAQVEERLAFFENGAPPTKNADAMAKVLNSLQDMDVDEEVAQEQEDMPLTTLEVSPKKKEKKDKGKKRKRNEDEMDVDEDAAEEDQPEKKVKLSKEEKKALKKAKKAEAKTAAKETEAHTNGHAEVNGESGKKKDKSEKKAKKEHKEKKEKKSKTHPN